MSTIDPNSLAQQLATAYTQSARSLLSRQTSTAQTQSTALTKLRSALTGFDGALSSLSSSKGVKALSASLDNTAVATATATAKAAPGSYSFFVERLATTHQTSHAAVPAAPAAGAGTLAVTIGAAGFDVALAAADTDGDGQVGAAEIARAINTHADNAGRVVASVVTVDGKSQLLLSAGQSGAAGEMTLDAAGVADPALKAALGTQKLLVQGRDALVWLGEKDSGVKIEQPSNTYTGIAGVSVTFTKAMTPGDALATLSVADDVAGTAKNLQSFVDAYNALQKLLGEQTLNGNAASGSAGGAFASDSSVLSLKNRLGVLARQSIGGVRLADYGVSIGRDGQMSLDSTKLGKGLAAKPDGLATLLGSARAGSSSGVLGSLSDLVDRWKAADGPIAQRLGSIEKTQKSLTSRGTELDRRYESLYQRYLQQFSKLQQLQTSLAETSGLFAPAAAT